MPAPPIRPACMSPAPPASWTVCAPMTARSSVNATPQMISASPHRVIDADAGLHAHTHEALRASRPFGMTLRRSIGIGEAFR
jgi:hypothetical protein